MDPARPSTYSALQEPEYNEWPPIDEALLARCRASLNHNLSSVLNGPQTVQESFWNPADLAILPRTDIPEVFFDELLPFYGHLRPLMHLWNARGGAAAQGGDAAESNAALVDSDFAEALSVPPIYFSSKFSVADVCAGEDTLNPLMQQKLSHYLDVVEMELVKQTSQRSRSFFAALTQMRDLHEQVSKAVTRIRTSRLCMTAMQDTLVRSGVAIPQLRRRNANMEALRKQLMALEQMQHASGRFDELVAARQFADAIDVLRLQQKLLVGPELRGVACVADEITVVNQRLDELSRRMQAELLDCVLAPDFNHTAMERDGVPALEGLVRIGCLTAVWQTLRERNVAAVKAAIRMAVRSRFAGAADGTVAATTVPETKSPVPGRPPPPPLPSTSSVPPSARGADEGDDDDVTFLRNVKTNEFLATMDAVYSACVERLDKLRYLTELLTLVTPMPDLVSETLQSLCELLQLRVVRILKARADENARLSLEDFATLFERCMAFVSASERMAACTTQCYSLRGCLMTQAKAFLDSFNRNQTRQLTAVLEGERWAVAEVPAEFQRLADQLCGGGDVVRSASVGDSDSVNQQVLVIRGRQYRCVNAALLCVRCVWEFAECARKLPHLAVDMISMIRRIFKLFNQRSAHLILGAEAMHGPAGLKSITTKHLGLCSESVDMVGALLPPIVDRLRALLPPQHHVLLDEFAAVSQEYQDLHRDIHTKLVTIMRDTVASYVAQMRGMVLEWGAFPEKLSPYVTGLVDKTQTLFRLLQKILQHDQLETLFDDIMAMYYEQLAQAYRSLELPTRNARLRLANDVKELCARLNSFEGIHSTLGTKLLEEFGTPPPPPPPINIDI